MSYQDQKRRIRRLAQALEKGTSVDQLEMNFLIESLWQIGNGADANVALGVKLRKGQKNKDLIDRQRLSFILHWIQCAMYPDPGSEKQELSLAKACEKAELEVVPLAKQLYPGGSSHSYNAEYLERCHGAPEYKHLHTSVRTWIDDDFPYQ